MGRHLCAPAVAVVDNPEPLTPSLRVVAVDADWGMDLFCQEMLLRLGHQVFLARDCGSMKECCRSVRPDLVLLDVWLPDGDALEAAREIDAECPVPFLIVSDQQHLSLLARIEQAEYVFGYLPKPITERFLAPAMIVAAAHFRHLQQLRSRLTPRDRPAHPLRGRGEEHRPLELARIALTHRLGIRDADALRRMQALAAQENCSLTKLAQNIVAAEQLFVLLEKVPPPRETGREERPILSLRGRTPQQVRPKPHSLTE